MLFIRNCVLIEVDNKKYCFFIVPLSKHASFFLLCRSLPPEIGELTEMRDLTLANNLLRALPYELGKCFQLTVSHRNYKLHKIFSQISD